MRTFDNLLVCAMFYTPDAFSIAQPRKQCQSSEEVWLY